MFVKRGVVLVVVAWGKAAVCGGERCGGAVHCCWAGCRGVQGRCFVDVLEEGLAFVGAGCLGATGSCGTGGG